MTSDYAQKIDAIDPAVLTTLDDFFKKAVTDVEKHLNQGVISVNSSGSNWLIPAIDVKAGKPTIPSPEEKEGAFQLNEPGEVSVEFVKVPMNTIILRYLFSYESALFAIKSSHAFDVVVGAVIKDMIEELRELKGYNEFGYSYGNYYGQFTRPGSDVIFRDSEGKGVELRLYSDTSRLPNNNK